MICTGNGDFGKSSTLNRFDIYKDDIIFDILGTADELNAHLGIAKSVSDGDIYYKIENIQKELILASSDFAGGKPFDYISAEKNITENIKLIYTDDLMSGEFVLYGKCELGARLDTARAVCRRLERAVVKYYRMSMCPQNAVAYFNRLSDYLFLLARYAEKGGNL